MATAFNWTPKRDAQLRAWAAAVPPVTITVQAERLGCSRALVGKRRKTLGIVSDRTDTAAAAEARRVDSKHRRALLEEHLIGDAESLRKQIWQPHTYFDWVGRDGKPVERTVNEPTPADKLKLMQAAGLAIDKSLRIADHDSDSGSAAAVGLLDGIAAAIRGAADTLRSAEGEA